MTAGRLVNGTPSGKMSCWDGSYVDTYSTVRPLTTKTVCAKVINGVIAPTDHLIQHIAVRLVHWAQIITYSPEKCLVGWRFAAAE